MVGSGPNGLAAAVTLARAGLSVHVIEGAETPGGGCRTQELTLPGFWHDVCSAVHPLASASPFFTGTDLAAHGVRLLTPKVAFAHPLDGGRAAAVSGSVERDRRRSSEPTAAPTGGCSGRSSAIRRLILPTSSRRCGRSLPAHPLAMARFGLEGLLPASVLARRFRGDEAQALLAGVAGHTMLPLTAPLTSALRAAVPDDRALGRLAGGRGRQRPDRGRPGRRAHRAGRPRSRPAAGCSRSTSLPAARAVLLDVTPRQLVALAGRPAAGQAPRGA